MILAFSGTSRGMTTAQRATVRRLFIALGLHILHHGDCIGSDAQAHAIAKHMRARIVGHPPDDDKARAFCDFDEIRAVAPYLVRNTHIAQDGVDGLIAAPPNYSEVKRGEGGGTWSTVRRARKLHRRIWLVFPDGSVKEDQGA